MARTAFRQTLWNRLKDPSQQIETSDLKSMKRDLENLLSTRASFPIYSAFESDDPLNGTLPFYGLKDFSEYNDDSGDYTQVLADGIRDVLVKFEPRLQDIRVQHVSDYQRKGKFTMIFSVTAKLRDASRDVSERIALDVSTGICSFDSEAI
jgi:type VI secretion system lysozyme-like protein